MELYEINIIEGIKVIRSRIIRDTCYISWKK